MVGEQRPTVALSDSLRKRSVGCDFVARGQRFCDCHPFKLNLASAFDELAYEKLGEAIDSRNDGLGHRLRKRLIRKLERGGVRS